MTTIGFPTDREHSRKGALSRVMKMGALSLGFFEIGYILKKGGEIGVLVRVMKMGYYLLD